jgi:hypothetical protein
MHRLQVLWWTATPPSDTESRTMRRDAGALWTPPSVSIASRWAPAVIRSGSTDHLRVPHRVNAAPTPPRHPPLGPPAEAVRRCLHSRDDARSKLSWLGTRRDRRGPGWHQGGGKPSDLLFGGPPVEGRCDPGPGLRRVTSGALHLTDDARVVKRVFASPQCEHCRGAGTDESRAGEMWSCNSIISGALTARARAWGDPPARRKSSSGLGCRHHDHPKR